MFLGFLASTALYVLCCTVRDQLSATEGEGFLGHGALLFCLDSP